LQKPNKGREFSVVDPIPIKLKVKRFRAARKVRFIDSYKVNLDEEEKHLAQRRKLLKDCAKGVENGDTYSDISDEGDLDSQNREELKKKREHEQLMSLPPTEFFVRLRQDKLDRNLEKARERTAAVVADLKKSQFYCALEDHDKALVNDII
jgi:hypothetical protein